MKIALLIFVLIILIIAGIRYIEIHSIFYPMRDIAFTPPEVGLTYEDIYFTTSDNKKLNGWFIPAEDAKFTVILAHGNAGNISHRLEKLLIFNKLGVNVFIFDYRGYGKSQGVPNEIGIYNDMDAAYEYLTKTRNVPPDEIILYGESIGGAPAINLASKKPVKAIITEETFTSVKDMAKVVYPFMPSFLFSNRLNSVPKIKKVQYWGL